MGMLLNTENYDEFTHSEGLKRAYTELEGFSADINCTSINNLNDIVKSGKIDSLIRDCEELQKAQLEAIARRIINENCQIIMLSGPSASGKTTTAKKLAVCLRKHGKESVLISLDDYYMERNQLSPNEHGIIDYECISAIDVALFQNNLQRLLQGGAVILPRFCFIEGKRTWQGEPQVLSENSFVITEGIHGLNPALLAEDVLAKNIFRIFVCPLYPIPEIAVVLRIIRRGLRDCRTRGTSIECTLRMWELVKAGETKWIFPFSHKADVVFNSAMLYEPVALKHEVNLECEKQSCGILTDYLPTIESADCSLLIPSDSILREFIGGCSL